MPLQEEKTDVQEVPQIHFVWFGPFKESSFKGPQSLGLAKNALGHSYPITYWVEEERVAEAEAVLSDHANIRVKSIREAIHSYCVADKEMEERIYQLLAKYKTENLLIIGKELLAPIILSLASGYYFDTSIFAEKTITLPILTQAALPRNLEQARSYNNAVRKRFWAPADGEYLQFKPLIPNSSGMIYPTSSDLYAFYSAQSATGETSADSKALFSRLAIDTIETWEAFFEEKIESLPNFAYENTVELLKRDMIDGVLMKPITLSYAPQAAEDLETIAVLDKRINYLWIQDVSTGQSRCTLNECGFTTIDGIPGRPFQQGGTSVYPRELFLEGKPTGITKYITGAWKNEYFKAYIERKLAEAAEEAADSAEPGALRCGA